MEYRCAGLFGGKGDSLGVNRAKKIWKDFSDDTKGGDLISLFIARAGGDKISGMKAVYEFLGERQERKIEIQTQATFKSPKCDWEELDGEVYQYLTGVDESDYGGTERGLPDAVLEKYHVKMANRYFHEVQKTLPCYVFLYQKNKKICYAKYVALERNNGKKIICSQAGGLQILFGMDAIPKGSDRIIITTGEIDAISFAAQGLPAVSVVNGDANDRWIELCWDWLKPFKHIYLSFDMDESGQAALEKVAGRLGRERCYKVALPYKDANACLLAGVDLAGCLASSQELKPDRLVMADKLYDGVLREIKLGTNSHRGIPFLGWSGDDGIGFNIRPQELTVWTGFEFSGKSTLLYQMASWLMATMQQKILLISLEEPAERIVRHMLTQVLAYEPQPDDLEDEDTSSLIREIYHEFFAKNLIVYDYLGSAPLKKILESCQYAVSKYGVSNIIIDSVARTDLDIEDNQKANEFMDKIVTSMNETQAHYHLVAHAKKSSRHPETSRESIPNKQDIKGSGSIPVLATNIIAVWRNQMKENILKSDQKKIPKEEVEKWDDAVLAIRKQKLTGEIGEFKLFFNKACRRFRRARERKDYPYKPADPF